MGRLVAIEGLAKYFIVQAGGSAIFFATQLWGPNFAASIVVLAIRLKLGAVPCYQWVPSVIRSLRWSGCLLLATLQKASPLIAVTLSEKDGTVGLILLLGSLSVLIGGLKGFNQSHLRPLIGYSSIAHTG